MVHAPRKIQIVTSRSALHNVPVHVNRTSQSTILLRGVTHTESSTDHVPRCASEIHYSNLNKLHKKCGPFGAVVNVAGRVNLSAAKWTKKQYVEHYKECTENLHQEQNKFRAHMTAFQAKPSIRGGFSVAKQKHATKKALMKFTKQPKKIRNIKAIFTACKTLDTFRKLTGSVNNATLPQIRDLVDFSHSPVDGIRKFPVK